MLPSKIFSMEFFPTGLAQNLFKLTRVGIIHLHSLLQLFTFKFFGSKVHVTVPNIGSMLIDTYVRKDIKKFRRHCYYEARLL